MSDWDASAFSLFHTSNGWRFDQHLPCVWATNGPALASVAARARLVAFAADPDPPMNVYQGTYKSVEMSDRGAKFVALGLALGAGLGIAFHQFAIGVAVGLTFGAVISALVRRRQR